MIAVYSDRILGVEGDWQNLRAGYVVIDGDRIVDISTRKPSSVDVVNMAGGLLLPALVDPHTHSIFAGDRAEEYHMRLSGVSYEEIARRGGGIVRTVEATRNSSDAQLASLLRRRLEIFFRFGVLTVEVKTGYGVYPEDELRLLKVIIAVSSELDWIDVFPTFLAHVPPRDVDMLVFVEEFRQAVAMAKESGAVFFDVFCDSVGFELPIAIKLLKHARNVGLKLKVHAEELVHTGISCEAARLGAVSADHLIKAGVEDFMCMREYSTVPVLLPGTAYMLGEDISEPLAGLRELAMDFALATDFNPGSCPIISPWLIISLAVRHFGFTPIEALKGFTVNAARALALEDRGVIGPGYKAYLLWTAFRDLNHVGYLFGVNPVSGIVRGSNVMLLQSGTWI